jgi:hypothetical protein
MIFEMKNEKKTEKEKDRFQVEDLSCDNPNIQHQQRLLRDIHSQYLWTLSEAH